MLKAHVDNEIWLVQQPHHAQVSGFLAAHWGGSDGFVSPGHYSGITHPDHVRDEVVLGIAEHDNGWWESEALPRFSERDGLPIGVGEAAPPTDANEFTPWITGGFDRWRMGIGRLADAHPYAALLVSLHAYWLYAVVFEDLITQDTDSLRHFVFGDPEVAVGLVSDASLTRSFLIEQQHVQSELMQRVLEDDVMADAIRPQYLMPHFRLLQLADSMSLLLALNDTAPHQFPHIPRAGWHDRVTITWTRRDARTIELDPFPFDVDGLRVSMPVRIVPDVFTEAATPPLTRLHGAPLETLNFQFVRRRT